MSLVQKYKDLKQNPAYTEILDKHYVLERNSLTSSLIENVCKTVDDVSIASKIGLSAEVAFENLDCFRTSLGLFYKPSMMDQRERLVCQQTAIAASNLLFNEQDQLSPDAENSFMVRSLSVKNNNDLAVISRYEDLASLAIAFFEDVSATGCSDFNEVSALLGTSIENMKPFSAKAEEILSNMNQIEVAHKEAVKIEQAEQLSSFGNVLPPINNTFEQ